MFEPEPSYEQLLERCRRAEDFIDAMGGESALREYGASLAAHGQLLSVILANTPVMVACLDAGFNFIWVNDAYAAATHRAPASFVGQNHFALYPHDENQAIFQRVVDTGEAYVVNGRLFDHPDQPERGTTYWDWSLTPVKDPDGTVQRLVLTLADATERVMAQNALRESERRLRRSEALLKAAERVGRSGGWVWDVEREHMYWSDETYRIHGMKPGEPEPGSPEHVRLSLECYHPEDRPLVEAAFRRCVEDGEAYDMELRFRPVNGGWMWVGTRGEAEWRNGRIARVVGTISDITERKQAEEALRESEHKFRSLVEQAAEMLFLFDTQGRIIDVNRAAVLHSGYTKDELLTMTVGDIELDRHGFVTRGRYWMGIQPGDAPVSFDVVHRRKDGSTCPVEVTLSRVSIGDGHYVMALARDMTERKRSEEARAQLEEQLRQAQKLEAVGRLAGGVAHKLNNLLVPILGYSEILLADYGEDASLRRALETILNAGGRAADLVRGLLGFGRKEMLELRSISINDVLAGAHLLLRGAIRDNIELQVIPGGDLPLLRADTGRLEQAVVDLALSAQRAMPDGGRMTIRTLAPACESDAPPLPEGPDASRCVLLQIRDSGPGLDAETREHIFEPFVTIEADAADTGLGLATAYGIVKQHGGDITVDSEPGRGTTFTIYLPVDETAPGPRQRASSAPEARGGAATVLLVDDHDQVRDLALTILERHGHRVLVAGSGDEALRVLSEHGGPVNLLVADIVMPGMNGRELFDRIAPGHSEMGVLYMSGYVDEVIGQDGVIDDGAEFIKKPFTVQGFADKVRQILDSR